MDYEPMEIIVRRPSGYAGTGNYEQKITIVTCKSEAEIMGMIKENIYIASRRVYRIQPRERR